MKIQYNHKLVDVFLCDDGTLDTVIEANGKEYRFDQEYASTFRRRDGLMTEKGLRILAIEAMDDDFDLEDTN